ncbi:hypothetical protein GCM10009414_01160 [Tatumella terrea]|uniref:Cyclic di-GMP binding protein YcgR n=1 Tax=Tatumella terrea TaxID=419007 RepID=A0ABW1VZF9_9GAMM|nr:hypothetical protein [Tatumella sp. JGM118]MBS0909941.1 hypothetical protein [Tatumella sp. JGM118]
MAGVNTDLRTLRNDRFELVAILRTLLKEKHRLSLSSEEGHDFELLRVESSRVYLSLPQADFTLPATLELSAEGREAKIIFTLNAVREEQTAAGTILTGDLGDEFNYFQRRINLRVPLPLWKNFTLTLPLSGFSAPQPFIIYDFSVGGLGVYTPNPLSQKIKVGSVFKKALLSLGEYGEFKANIEIIALNELEEELPEYPGYQQRMSVRFTNLSLINQRNFQKIAYAFEVNFKRKR